VCAKCADNDVAEAKGLPERAAVARALAGSSPLLVTTHARPDGDALGSMLALHLAAAGAGKESTMLLTDAVPARYAFLFERHRPVPAGRFAELADRAQRVVVLDTCAAAQLGPIAEPLRVRREKVVVIDHHATADDIAAVVWRDESAAAAGVMLLELLEHLSWPVEAEAAEALMTAIGTDTGWLRYPNTDARALAAMGKLARAGARPNALYARIYQGDRPQRVRLLAAALSSLQLHADGRLAVMTLSREDFARTGARPDETENIVSEPMRIAAVEVSGILIAQADGHTRVSLRSRGSVDVAAIARGFGGGGHAQAAGYRDDGQVPAAAERLLAACTEALRAAGR
jgi:phosphoesterase RecJ-like protein